jgi:hypothetical protein
MADLPSAEEVAAEVLPCRPFCHGLHPLQMHAPDCPAQHRHALAARIRADRRALGEAIKQLKRDEERPGFTLGWNRAIESASALAARIAGEE